MTNRFKVNSSRYTPIPFHARTKIESIQLNADGEEIRDDINCIRLAFFNDARLEVILDFRRPANFKEPIFFPDKSFVADFDFCRIHSVQGALIPNSAVYLYFEKPRSASQSTSFHYRK
jgi:hypothetical protein